MELVDLSDSKSDASACGFESHLRHHKDNFGNIFWLLTRVREFKSRFLPQYGGNSSVGERRTLFVLLFGCIF